MSDGKRSKVASIRKLPPIDVSTLVAEVGVPVTTFQPARKSFDMYEPVFDLLMSPGLSVLLPLEYRGALAEAAQQKMREQKGRYCVRQVSAGECRIWRLE